MYLEYVGKAKKSISGWWIISVTKIVHWKSSVVNLNPSNTSKLIHHLSKDIDFLERLLLLRKSVSFKVLRIGFVNI